MLLVPFFRGLARHLHLACLALTATTAAVLAQTNPPSAADGFDPNIDGVVMAMAKQGDGKIIVVGQFGNVQPNGGAKVARNNIARFNADGTLDTTFDPNANGAVRVVALEKVSGRIVIGGDFTTVGGNTHNYVARLNPDGSTDETFTASIGKSLDSAIALPTTPQVLALVLQSNGDVIVGGTFGSASSNGVAPMQRNNLVRFKTTAGALDAAYNPNPDGVVLALALYLNDTVLVGGGFKQFTPNAQGTPVMRNRVARLQADGTVDSGFDPEADDGVTAIAVQADGKIYLGGYFSTLRPNVADSFIRNHIARVNADGTVDGDFTPTVGGSVYTIVVAPTGDIYVGGHFQQVLSRGNVLKTRAYIAKFAVDGTTADTFSASLNFDVNAITFQADGKIVVGGAFTRAFSAGTNGTQVIRNHMARLLPDGSLDTTFETPSDGRVLTSVTLPDNSVVVGGTFTTIGGARRAFLAKIKADGTVDPAFYPVLNSPVYAMAYDKANDKILIGGAFTQVGTVSTPTTRNHIARLDSSGNLDTGFDPNLDGNVASIVIQPVDGAIVVGGAFVSAQPAGTDTAVTRNHILRLTSAGQLDTTFNPSSSSPISVIVLQSDGKLLVGGSFTYFQPGATGNAVPRNNLARLNADGTVDSGYNPDPLSPNSGQGQVNAIVIQSDGKAIVAGQFQGFLLPHATTITARNFIARINTDGTIDSTFDPNANGFILALALTSDGKIIAGGQFTDLQPNGATDPTVIRYVVRLKSDGTIDFGFNLNLNERIGNRVDYLAIQPSGDLLVGGSFTSLQAGTPAPVVRNHFAKIKSDGTLDTTFDPHPSGTTNAVAAISLQADGNILVGGSFNDLGGGKGPDLARYFAEGTPDYGFNNALSTDGTVNAIAVRPSGTEPSTQLGGFAWLESTGALRTTFKPTITTQGRINSSLVLPTGDVLIAGLFNDSSGNATNSIVKVSPAGVVDPTFSVTAAGVTGMLRQPDGKLIIYGNFTTLNGVGQNYIARLNADGTADTTFNPNPNGSVYSAVLQTDGSIVIGGVFTGLTPGTDTTATTRNYAARITSDGKLDANFNPNLNGAVYTLALQSDGKILMGGTFTGATIGTATTVTTRNHILRFNADGTLDSFDPNANNTVYSIAVQPDDQNIVVGGAFTTIGTTARTGLARLAPDGTVDTSFTASTNDYVNFVTLAPDKSIFIAGFFTTVTESSSTVPVSRFHLAKLSADGKLDLGFNPALGGDVTNLTVAPDNSVLVSGTFLTEFAKSVIVIGGAFNKVGGQTQPYLAELNADGSINAHADAPNQQVNALLSLPDGHVIAGGAFTKIGANPRNGIARFAADGTLDTFNPSTVGNVTLLALQPDGGVIAAVAGGTSLVRFDKTGAIDGTFNATLPFASAAAIAVQRDGKIVVASGVAPGQIVRLNSNGSVDSSFATVSVGAGGTIQTLTLQTDGAIIVAGSFSTIGGSPVSNLARLTASGAVDQSFVPAPNGNVSAVALQLDGRLLLAGSFTAVGDLTRFGIARVSNTAPASETLGLSADGRTVSLLRSGTSGEIAGVAFETSTDGQSWVYLGNGSPIGAHDWQLTNLALPTDRNIYIRAHEIVSTCAGKATGVYETVLLTNLGVQIPSAALVVAPVASSTTWDKTHYVWTINGAGILRISDAFSNVTFDSSKTVLINGGSVGGDTTSASSSRLADLSTRGLVTSTTPLISGFSIVGTSPRPVLIRAAGPALAPLGVPHYLKVPRLVLYNNVGTVIATNTGWDASLLTDFARTGAFPFTPGSTDAAFLVTLAPGTYTVQVADAGAGDGGETLVEIYDAGSLDDASARLMNLSTRASVGAGSTLIGGLVVSGSTPKTMLVRGIGPALGRYGVSNPLGDPIIAVYDASGSVVATNDNWSTSARLATDPDYAAAVSSAAQRAGAFPLDANSTDAALIITLPAGSYTVQLRGTNGTSGNGMIEVYEMP